MIFLGWIVLLVLIVRPELEHGARLLLTLLELLQCRLLTSSTLPSIDKVATLRSSGHLRIHILLSLILLILSLLLVVATALLLMNFRFWCTGRQKKPRLEYGATFLLRYWWCSARGQHWGRCNRCLYRRCSTGSRWRVRGLSTAVSSRCRSLVGLLFLMVDLLLIVKAAWSWVAETAGIVSHWRFGDNSILLMEAVEITSLYILVSQKQIVTSHRNAITLLIGAYGCPLLFLGPLRAMQRQRSLPWNHWRSIAAMLDEIVAILVLL